MDEPARKRRKTSSPGVQDILTSPLKQPPRRLSLASHTIAGAERPSSPLKEPPRRLSISPTKATFDRASSPLRKPPRRPSFASPTKASLARNYPSLLPQRPASSGSETPRGNGRGDLLARGKQARAFVLGDKDADSQTREGAMNGDDADQHNTGAERPRASKPQKNITPRARRTMASTRAAAAGNTSDDDADLPATPSQRKLDEQDTPRRGILFSSPHKRPPRLKDPVKQSPLKPKVSAVHEDRPEISRDDDVSPPEQKEKSSIDPELEKRKQEKLRLLRELDELESQVSRCTKEIVKIQGQSATHVLPPSEREDLIVFVNKISKASGEEEQAPPISSLLCSFLPFSTRVIPPPKLQQAKQKPIASHQPLDLDDPLPYLEMFTALKFNTHITLPQDDVSASSDSVHQQHIIDISGPQELLKASLSVLIDTVTNTIIELKILRLPSWAERELGAFIRAKARKQDLGNVCWAINSYWEVIKKRAEYWHKCEISFSHLIPGRTSGDTENINNRSGKTMLRKDLNRHLGRDALVLEDEHVMLRIGWKIGFDWSGEAESEINVEPAVPQVCKFPRMAFARASQRC